MKKILQICSLALAVFTFAGSVGIGVFTHFCHEDGIEQSFILPQENHCDGEKEQIKSCCAHEEQVAESDCCNDQVDFFQVDFEQFESSHFYHFVPQEIVASFNFEFVQTNSLDYVSQVIYANPPPNRTAKQILIQHQVFRI